MLVHHDSSAAPQTVQTASPVCGTKVFSSVRLYTAPQLHRTIVAILGICPRGTPDQPPYLCDHTPLGGVVRLEGRSSTKRPRLAGCKGRGRWRRVCSNAHLGRFPAAIVTGVDRIRCSVTQIFRYRLTRRLRAGAPSPTTIPPSHVAARSKRARRNVAWHFRPQRHVLSTQWNFLSAGRAFDRDQRMLELWNNWYETLASMEALATVIVIVVVAAGVITLAESRRR